MAIENISELEKIHGLEEGKLQEMITSEENHKIDISNLYVAGSEQLRSKVEQARISEREQTLKSLATNLGMTEDKKNPDAILNFVTNKYASYEDKLKESGQGDEERFKAKDEEIQRLRAAISAKDSDFETFKKNIQSENYKRTLENKIKSSIKGDLLIPNEALIMTAKAQGFEFDLEGEKAIIKKDGEIQRDKDNVDPLSLEDFFNEFSTPYIKKPEGAKPPEGRNNPNRPPPNPSVKGTFEDFEREMKELGHEINSEFASREMSKRIKEGVLKVT